MRSIECTDINTTTTRIQLHIPTILLGEILNIVHIDEREMAWVGVNKTAHSKCVLFVVARALCVVLAGRCYISQWYFINKVLRLRLGKVS